MNELTTRDDRDFRSEAVIERLAQEIAAAHGLAEREWCCGDERRDTLLAIIAVERKVGVEQLEFLLDCLNDIAAPAGEDDDGC
jgi:hypothetical protein